MDDTESGHYNPNYTDQEIELSNISYSDEVTRPTLDMQTISSDVSASNIEPIKKQRQSFVLFTVVIVFCLLVFIIPVIVFFLKSVAVKEVTPMVQHNITEHVKQMDHSMSNGSVKIDHIRTEVYVNNSIFKTFTKSAVVRARSRLTSTGTGVRSNTVCVEIPDTTCMALLPYVHTYFPNSNDLTTLPPNAEDFITCHSDAAYLICSKLFPQCITDPDPVMPCRHTCENVELSCLDFNTTYDWPFNCDSYPEGSTGEERACSTNTRDCHESLSLESGSLYEVISLNYPDYYRPNSECLWRLTSPLLTGIQIDIVSVDIEDGFDELVIGFGDNPYVQETTMISVVSGMNNTFVSPMNSIWIRFESDYSIERSGFELHVKVVEDAVTCPGQFKLLTGELCDGKYDCPDKSDETKCLPDCVVDMYTTIGQTGTLSSMNCSSNYSECVYLFTTPHHTRATLEFMHFRDVYQYSEGFRFGVGLNPFDEPSTISSTPSTGTVFEIDSNEGWIWFTTDQLNSFGSFTVLISSENQELFIFIDENDSFYLDSREVDCHSKAPDTYGVMTWIFNTSANMNFRVNFTHGLVSLFHNTIEIGIGHEPSRESTILFKNDEDSLAQESITVGSHYMWVKYIGYIYKTDLYFRLLVSSVPRIDDNPAFVILDDNTVRVVSYTGINTGNNTKNRIWIIGTNSSDISTSIVVQCLSIFVPTNSSSDTEVDHIPAESYVIIGRGRNSSNSSTIVKILRPSSSNKNCPDDFVVHDSYVWVKFVDIGKEGTEFNLSFKSTQTEDLICKAKASVTSQHICSNRVECPDFSDEIGCQGNGSSICGTRILRPATRVVGGSFSAEGSWPWMGSLQIVTSGKHLCGCTLIDEDWAITAAHCTLKHEHNELQIMFGSTSLKSQSNYRVVVKVSMVYPHPEYKDTGEGFDISILKLANSVPFTDYIRPVCLDFDETEYTPGQNCYVSGWGYDGVGFNDKLQDAAVPIMTNDDCNELQGSVVDIMDSMMCAGYPQGGIDTCAGDSGGPLVCFGEDNKWHLAGITSFGIGCALESRPGVYTRVSDYKDFIDLITEIFTRQTTFQCPSGLCLLKRFVCDGENDCSDGEDEAQCTGIQSSWDYSWESSDVQITQSESIVTCGTNQFGCSGRCVHINYQCDGYEDCPDGTDEYNCHCKNWEIMCSDGSCIGYWQKCDGINDCIDGTDELNCTDSCSSDDFFRCDNGNCVYSVYVCDKRDNCGDNSDEQQNCEAQNNYYYFYDLSNIRFSGLSRPTSHSVVEVFEFGLWQHVHITNFRIANVVCRQLGFGGAASVLEDFSNHTVNEHCMCGWLELDCRGDEQTLNECPITSRVNCETRPMTSLLCSNECSEDEAICHNNASPYQCISKSSICDGHPDCEGVDEFSKSLDESQCLKTVGDAEDIISVYKNESWSKICVQPGLWRTVYSKNICYQLHKGSPLFSEFVPANDADELYAVLRTNITGNLSDDYRTVDVQGLLISSTTCEGGFVLRIICSEQEFENEIEACGISQAPTGRILGGDTANPGRWPWQVSLKLNGNRHCGGSLINNQWVVTAAHCFHKYLPKENYEVWLGSINSVDVNSRTLVRRNLSKIIANQRNEYIENDIALVKLGEPVVFDDTIQPVCLPNSSMVFEPGSYGYTTGWGALTMYGEAPDLLQEVRVPIVSKEYCRRHMHFTRVTDEMVCLKMRQEGQGACHGDSGGPFVVNRGGRWYLVGIVNGGLVCGGLEHPAIYARVSSFLDFIYYTLWQHRLIGDQ